MITRELIEDLGSTIVGLLSDFGRTMATAAAAPLVAWHVETPRSGTYALVAMLVFSPRDQPDVELAVVTVALLSSLEQIHIDIIDREALGMAELRFNTSADLATLRDRLVGFLEEQSAIVRMAIL